MEQTETTNNSTVPCTPAAVTGEHCRGKDSSCCEPGGGSEVTPQVESKTTKPAFCLAKCTYPNCICEKMENRVVKIVVPCGYKSVQEFLDDCGFERATDV